MKTRKGQPSPPNPLSLTGPGGLIGMADRLHSAAIRMLRRLRAEDRASGLSGPRASALSVIVFRGPLPLGALAEAEQVRPPTITRLVAGLESEALVRRKNDPDDGRVQLVEATAAGRRVLQRGRRRRVERLAKSIGGRSAEDRAVLDRAAEIIAGLA